jgi:transposase-like protein
MLLAPSVVALFKWRQFEPEMILLAVGWYLRFSLSYRDVEELLAERGLHADHVTVWRWVQRLRPGNSAPIATAPPTDQRLLAGG